LVVCSDFEVGGWQTVLHGVVLVTGAASRVCRWLAYTRLPPLIKVGDLRDQWKEMMEDRTQIKRLAQAFWKEEGCVGPVPRSAVEALRAACAERDGSREVRPEHRELWKQVRARGDVNEEDRRGRSTSGRMS
jgi:hypothetical protein